MNINDVNVAEYEGLCIPGGWPHTSYFGQINSARSLNIIKTIYEQKKIIATLCFGIFSLGEACLLSNVKATTYVGHDIELSKITGDKLISYGSECINKSIVIHDNIISNIGPAVADEASFRLIELLTSESYARNIYD